MKTLSDFYRLFPNRPALAQQPKAVPAAPVVVAARAAPAPVAPRYRQRALGTGYGRSSGYALDGRYIAEREHALVRVC
ncbi:MAG: hypothetical protein K0M70_13345 [Arenimonas sp.]|uniref:hypothetical protein n=1 Tax=Arenimonas sp. TaxID=1872635 RepID=UPI0025C31F39|nr:hypothetical protein [Arenimonas sp.]MBW8368830.1 hypothetical protein [Arenimonas sp.]